MVPTHRSKRKAVTRERIIEATRRVLDSQGIAGTTVRAIAREAACSEGALYNHFVDRVDLIGAVLESVLPAFVAPLHTLPQRVGKFSVAANLHDALRSVLRFFDASVTVFSAAIADPEIMVAFQRRIVETDRGPQLSQAHVARYLADEKARGRVSDDVDETATAHILLGTLFYYSFQMRLFGRTARNAQQDDRYIKRLVRSAIR